MLNIKQNSLEYNISNQKKHLIDDFFYKGPFSNSKTIQSILEKVQKSFLFPEESNYLYFHQYIDKNPRLKRIASREIICKLCQLILNYYDIKSGNLYSNPSYKKIANYLNCSFRTVMALFKEFKRMKWVIIIRKNVKSLKNGFKGISSIKSITPLFFIQAISHKAWSSIKIYKEYSDKKTKKENLKHLKNSFSAVLNSSFKKMGLFRPVYKNEYVPLSDEEINKKKEFIRLKLDELKNKNTS